MKKVFVLVVLFVLPIVAYLFFASGVYNFGKLPILTTEITEIDSNPNAIKLTNNITILGFLGSNIEGREGNLFNLNQKIYKRFYEFKDFQIVMLVEEGKQAEIEEFKKELGTFTDISKWRFIFTSKEEINQTFKSLNTNLKLDEKHSSPYVFIIDKERGLRGRDNDDDEGVKYGFNTSSVADLNNKMVDDVKIILAEYRLALKKNNASRSK
ncbi:hypothetical protein GCM10011414_25120 [Croceivirga lutea]|uniref:hypothetical protein n=1 Tax=Croceivirga lutea TaxID=1775167 RepID=UPI00163B0D56|nr:hypothetical protein [Croceivirga lutea]GGG54350.1 hypothetical protein GCM10011414_25120 [Croceivirga lutea]